jgi:hypothetical protein
MSDLTYDAMDGRSLRLLRKAAAERGCHVTLVQEPDRWTVRVIGSDGRLTTRCDAFDQLYLNADACRTRLADLT